MYKIQNVSGGCLSLVLERGGIILPNGSYYDLDGVCSRQWIHTDPTLKRLLGKTIRVVHDSESHISKMAIAPNEKAMMLLKKLEKKVEKITVPANDFIPTQKPNIRVDMPPMTVFPNVRPEAAKPKMVQHKFPVIPNDDPIIIDLSVIPDVPIMQDLSTGSKIETKSEHLIEELPAAAKADLAELFTEFPELERKPKKRGRKKKDKVETDGQNQSS